ncbi:MAG: acyl-CoA dehydrogenase [Syntrophus sp. (in: bacteria)]|nr:acyl-CoA dehydrogenase [Syntrophus sp. (in: bacteria)]
MTNLLVNMRDQQFLLFEQLGIEKLFATEKYKDFSRDDVLMLLSEAEKMAVNVILPTNVIGDREGCTFKDGKVTVPAEFHDAYRKFVEAGWLCPSRSVDVGGQGMPLLISNACSELFVAANYPFTMYPGLTNGAAALIENFGTEEQKSKYMVKMYAGQWGGTMCLTEPGAGSDVGALKTTAKRLPDGTFSITGTKCFISSGDHDLTENNIHPVLARIEGDPPGTAGISIFIVPKYRVNDDGTIAGSNDVQTGNIEHKMGIHGNATCTLNFGDNGNCIGELLGQEREGLKVMFQLMNEARIEVGYQALGTASACLERSVQYAKERIQSTPVWEMKNPDAKAVAIIQHPDVRRDLLWMKSRVEAMRAILYYSSYCLDVAESTDSKPEHDKWKGMAELLIPVCKAWVSDNAMIVCSKAMDVHGGYGFCAEYPVEQYLRDCKITTIYEGTNGIQSLDLVGRKLGSKKGANVMNLVGEIMATIGRAKASAGMKTYAAVLEEACNAIIDLTMTFGQLGKSGGFLLPILNASPFMDAFGDLVAGNILMQAALIAEEKLAGIYESKGADTIGKQRALVHDNPDVAFYAGKISAAKFFANEALTTVKARCEAIKFGDKSTLEIADESFAS